jgi:hypothetical protein
MNRQIWLCLCKTVLCHLKELQGDVGGASSLNFYSRDPPSEFADVLEQLIDALYRLHSRKVIVLIDEYDAPLNCSYWNGFYDKASAFFGRLYSLAFKDTKALGKACLMGIMEVRGLGIFSSFNNVRVFSVADKYFSEFFGFFTDEIKKYCDEDSLKSVLHWYNGYNIGNHQLINPWSFMSWLYFKEFESYWVGTSSVECLAEQISPVLHEALELATADKIKVIKNFSTAISYRAHTIAETSVWTMLIHTGYLTYKPSTNNRRAGTVFIPNYELRDHWVTEIKTMVTAKLGQHGLSDVLDALLKFETPILGSVFKRLLENTSYFDHGKRREYSYHMLCLTVLQCACLDIKDVYVASNQESGHGRPDITVEFRRRKRVIIIELKKSEMKKRLDRDARIGLQQIIDHEYNLKYKGYQCLAIGIAFFKKNMSKLRFEVLTPL